MIEVYGKRKGQKECSHHARWYGKLAGTMEAIVQRTNDQIRSVLESWSTVDTVTVLRFGTDRFDPSFFLSYDVYFHTSLPESDQREAAFTGGRAFEASLDGGKDRLLLEDVPVRLEYKSIGIIDELVGLVLDPEADGYARSTYGLYRIVHSDVIFARSTWLETTRGELADPPEEFWTRRRRVLEARMEHALSDLATAAVAQEELFFQLSLADFLENMLRALFTINRRFEPSGRTMAAEADTLPKRPEEFASRLEHLLRTDSAVKKSRKREIAQLIARSLLRLDQ